MTEAQTKCYQAWRANPREWGGIGYGGGGRQSGTGGGLLAAAAAGSGLCGSRGMDTEPPRSEMDDGEGTNVQEGGDGPLEAKRKARKAEMPWKQTLVRKEGGNVSGDGMGRGREGRSVLETNE